MPETEKKIGYEVEIEQSGREDGMFWLQATAYEVTERGGERRRFVHDLAAAKHRFAWTVKGGTIEKTESDTSRILFRPDPTADDSHARVELVRSADGTVHASSEKFHFAHAEARMHRADAVGPTRVRLTRTQQDDTRDIILWTAIRYSTESIRYPNYSRFLEYVLCGDHYAVEGGAILDTDEAGVFTTPEQLRERYNRVLEQIGGGKGSGRRSVALTGVDAYRALRDATEWFLKINCGVLPPDTDFQAIESDLLSRVGSGLERTHGFNEPRLQEAWDAYTVKVNGVRMLPYLKIVRDHLSDQSLSHEGTNGALIQCTGLIRSKLAHPCFVELLWSYWQEEGMLVQTINAVSNRFQNRRRNGERDPLLNLEVDTLRPLNNILWGYVQDELGRLSVVRRAYEYEHAYGLRLQGRAVGDLRPVDRRSKFLEAFHNFLLRCVQFYKLDDNTTVIADAFPVLNSIKEVHYLLAQAASNQFGALPSTARAEMLVQQWILGRPEMREFLGTRPAVPYPEPWMDRVDSMKTLQGWSDTSVVHFNDLATFGEQILLSVRYGAWSTVNDPASAANFLRYWRPQIQGYVHAYLAVTGIDLGADMTTQQSSEQRNLPPSVHLLRRLQARSRAT